MPDVATLDVSGPVRWMESMYTRSCQLWKLPCEIPTQSICPRTFWGGWASTWLLTIRRKTNDLMPGMPFISVTMSMRRSQLWSIRKRRRSIDECSPFCSGSSASFTCSIAPGAKAQLCIMHCARLRWPIQIALLNRGRGLFIFSVASHLLGSLSCTLRPIFSHI